MSSRRKLIPYPEERALEDVAYVQGFAPTRIFAILLPILRVEIKATITKGEPYDLIDRFLEQGIVNAGLDTTVELARFFALDEVLVDRALRFLTAIGHVTEIGGRLTLTELGNRSVQENRRYVVTREDRRRLYFDAFGSRPLTRAHYNSRQVTLLSGDELQSVLMRPDGPQFHQLHSTYSFRSEALTELAGNPERDHFNLPERIDEPKLIGPPELVYLPLYLIRAIQRGNQVRYFAYTQAHSQTDRDLSDLCAQTPEIVALCENEEQAARARDDQTWLTRWLGKNNLDGYKPVRLTDGIWRVTLPAASFDANGPVSLSKLGSFVVLGNNFFHVWCEDRKVRRRALIERIDSYLSSRTRINQADATELINRIARQLDLGTIDVATLRQMASEASRPGLSAKLARITEEH